MKENIRDEIIDKMEYLTTYGFYLSFGNTWVQQDPEDDFFFTFVNPLKKEVTFSAWKESIMDMIIKRSKEIKTPKHVDIYDELSFISWLYNEEVRFRKEYNI